MSDAQRTAEEQLQGRPRDDYTITIREPDENGIYSIVGSVPGLFLAGFDLKNLLTDLPLAVSILRKHNGDERTAVYPGACDAIPMVLK